MLLRPIRPLRGALLTVVGLALASAAGCGTPGPGFVGTWSTDMTPIKNNDVQKFFANSLKFSVTFREDGTLVSSWSEDGQEKTRSGTWQLVEGDGLRWRLTLKLTQPQADAMEVRVVSRSSRGMAVESLDGFRDEGGGVEFRRR